MQKNSSFHHYCHTCLVCVFVSTVQSWIQHIWIKSLIILYYNREIWSSSHVDCWWAKPIIVAVQVHERQINRMRTRSEWFLGCGDSLNSELSLCVSGMQTNTMGDVSRGNYVTDNLCDHDTNDSGSLRTGICMCAS